MLSVKKIKSKVLNFFSVASSLVELIKFSPVVDVGN
jgi:hypothetical protein